MSSEGNCISRSMEGIGFSEKIAMLIAHGLSDKEIVAYLHVHPEERLVGLVRALMEDVGAILPPYDSSEDTHRHQERVAELVHQVREELGRRATFHDESKLKSPEKEIFDEFTPKLKIAVYGSDEYKGFLKEMRVALDHHYKVNRHHPEHFENGVHAMSLIDLIEMLADWKAAGERMADGGNLGRSILINADRFGMSVWLKDCLLHTAEDLGWWDGELPEGESGKDQGSSD